MDNTKEKGIILETYNLLHLSKEVVQMAEKDTQMLNAVYREIGERMGIDSAMDIHQLFKGQQISFPVRFFNPEHIRKLIAQEYDGTNIKQLAVKYGYSEKTVRRMIKCGKKEDE